MMAVLIPVIKIVVIFLFFVVATGGILTWVERKMSAAIQDRIGPNRASVLGIKLFGLMHLAADGIKMIFKEPFYPSQGDKVLFFIAPLIAFVPPLLCFTVIPFGPPVLGEEWFLISDMSMGLLFILAIGALSVYGHTLGAWASNNKWSLLGGMRTAAQMLGYEMGLTLSILGIFMVYGTVQPQELILAQGDLLWGWLPKWGVVTQPLAFLLFMAASIAETKRAPFDMPEADSEIVAGYSTEYSALAFGIFFISEFMGIVLVGAFGAVLFLGGWQIPGLQGDAWWIIALQVAAFLGKTGLLIYIQMLIRWTVPRMRYDQVMAFGWKLLLPVGMANLVATILAIAVIDLG